MIILLAVLLTNPLDEYLKPYKAQVNENGYIIYGTPFISVFDSRGKLLLEFDTEGRKSFEAVFIDDYLFVFDGEKLELTVFDKNMEKILTLENIYWRYLIPVKNKRFFAVNAGLPEQILKQLGEKHQKSFVFNKYLHRFNTFEKYPPLIQEIKIDQNSPDLAMNPGEKFFRMTKNQRLDNFNYKKFFIVEKGKTLYVMNQLDETIFKFDDEIIGLEKATDDQAAFDGPKFFLNLPDFKSFSTLKPGKGKPFYYDRDEYYRDIYNLRYASLSLIWDFEESVNGFRIAYSVPVPPEKGQEIVGATYILNLYILELDHEGTPIGNPVIIENLVGSFAGIVDNKLYWLTMNWPEYKSGYLETFDISPKWNNSKKARR